jgi:hypothetical protein
LKKNPWESPFARPQDCALQLQLSAIISGMELEWSAAISDGFHTR